MGLNRSFPFMQTNRYLSLPGSRLVINPYDFEAMNPSVSQADYSQRPTLPLNIGYCDPFINEGTGLKLLDAVTVYECVDPSPKISTVVWQAEFSCDDEWLGLFGSRKYRLSGGAIIIGINGLDDIPLHVISTKPVDCNADKALLSVTIINIKPGSKFAIKISNSEKPVWDDAVCLYYGNKSGAYQFFVREYTDWKGMQKISVQFHVLEGNGDILTVSEIKLEEISSPLLIAKSQSCVWRPDRIGYKAVYSTGNNVEITDFLYNETCITRKIKSSHEMIIAGSCFDNAAFDGTSLLLSVENNLFSISFTNSKGCFAPQIVFFNSVTDFFCRQNASSQPTEISVIWACSFNGDELMINFNSASAPLTVTGFNTDRRLKRNEKRWEELLDKVPHPSNFVFEHTESKDVTPNILKQAYYSAWAQIIADVLPASPETGFPYESMAAGKASLWAYGAKECSYAASWEAFYGIMLYAHINPEVAWDIYLGLMSLVDEQGVLGGESLPSVKARTAWVLYMIHPDKERLYKVLPYLERYLIWRLQNPRWIYHNKTPDDQKDIDFVSSALIDVHHLIYIYRELGKEPDAIRWSKNYNVLYKKMSEWFFSDADLPCQFYLSGNETRQNGLPINITKTLHIPVCGERERNMLMRLFNSVYDPKKPFGNFQKVKVETMAYTIYGLIENERKKEAMSLAEITARDIAASGFLAEEYFHKPDGKIYPSGVRPSTSGCALLIDCVCMMNGIRLDGGSY